MIGHPALVKYTSPEDVKKEQEAKRALAAKKLTADGVAPTALNSTQAMAIIAAASPRPWKLIIGRITPMRIDIVDANGKLLMHFHPTTPVNEMTGNWENDAIFVIHLMEIISALEKKPETESVSAVACVSSTKEK